MKTIFKLSLSAACTLLAAQALAQVTFYENERFEGRSFTTQQPVENLSRYGFNDRASSVVVSGPSWEVCENDRFGGRCVILNQGRYPSLSAMGLNDRISSVRVARVGEERYSAPPAPPPTPAYDYRPRRDERLYEANVTSVRAVVGPPEQHCWVEREQVQQRSNNAVPGAIAGALLGGILGHQVGGGSGKDLATAGGAVAGAVVGANLGRNSGQGPAEQDVQRCSTTQSQAKPEYWDVVYNFRGTEHRMQLTAPPGPTVTVNRDGEPRTR